MSTEHKGWRQCPHRIPREKCRFGTSDCLPTLPEDKKERIAAIEACVARCVTTYIKNQTLSGVGIAPHFTQAEE